MPFLTNAYWAGVGTVVVVLALGFGGGMLIAEMISSDTAIPAPGTSRLERVMGEKKPKSVDHSGETTGNVLAEAVPLSVAAREDEASQGVAANQSTARAPEPAVAPVMRPEPAIAQALQNTAMDSIASPGAGRSVASLERQRSAPSRARQLRGSEAKPRVADRNPKPRDVIRRENDGGIRYVIRSPGGQRVSAAEIETLKQRLREQRGRQTEEIRADALSYQPVPRRTIGGLFD